MSALVPSKTYQLTITAVCRECGVETNDEWHTCLPCVRCEHDKPYHNVPDDYPANVLCSWPACDCAGYLGVAT